MDLLVGALLILISTVADRLRGTGGYLLGRRWVIVQGLALAYLLGARSWESLAIVTALWWLGSAPGWGEPVGAVLDDRPQNPKKKEWWQVLGLQNPGGAKASLFVRGLLWGVCLIPAAFHPHLGMGILAMVLVMTLSFPAATYISREPGLFGSWEPWAVMEVTRGLLAGTGAFFIGL